MARRRTKTVLSDDKKFSRMENWAKQQGFPDDTAKRLTEKYGMYAYDLMLKALMEPSKLNLPDIYLSKDAIHYLLGEDKNGQAVEGNVVSTEKIASLVGKDVATVEADINEFRAAHDIPTELPAPAPEVVAQCHEAQTRVEERVDTAASSEAPVQTASTEMAPGEAEWIEQELARMKGGRDSELSFDTLRRNGLTNDDMQNALTPDDVKDVHAGPTSQRLAQSARKHERKMGGSGHCLAGVQYATTDTLGICYGNYRVPKLPGCSSNSACFSNQAWEQSGCFTVFKFKNDRENGNPCLKNPCAGAIVNFDRGQTKHGHVTISDGKGGYNCDLYQTGERIASGTRADGKAYGDNFYISFTNDCTVSDDLARKMLHERYMREHPNAMENANRRSPNDPTRTPVTPEQADSISNINMEIINMVNARLHR